MPLARIASRLFRSTAGSAAVEAAIAVPLMLTVTLGAVETARFVYANMTMQNVAASAAGEIARDDSIDVARIADFLGGAGQLATPFDLDGGGRVIVTVVQGETDGPPQILWQAADSRPLSATSRIGASGGPAVLPDGLTLGPGETVAVGEVFYGMQPIVGSHPTFNEIYKVTVLRPRIGELHLPK